MNKTSEAQKTIDIVIQECCSNIIDKSIKVKNTNGCRLSIPENKSCTYLNRRKYLIAENGNGTFPCYECKKPTNL